MNEPAATYFALRGSLGIIIMVVTGLLAAVLLTDALVRGAWWIALQGAITIALVMWLEWWFLVSPALVVTRDGLVVVSALRRRVFHWNAIESIEPQFVPTLVLADGRRIRVFGAPTAGVDRAVGVRDLDVPANQPASVLVASARRLLANAPAPPRTFTIDEWRWRSVGIAAALAAATALALH